MRCRLSLSIAATVAATGCTPEQRVRVVQAVPPPALSKAQAKLLADFGLTPDQQPETTVGTPAAPAEPFTSAARSLSDANRAEDCLTSAIYYEARSETDDGQRAVAQVVLNRVRDRAFPSSVCGVVYQRSSKGCQFSFACDGSMDRPRDIGSWERARRVAAAALDGAVYAPVGVATFYHTFAVSPWWAPSLSRIGQIGAHIFYRWRGAMAGALSLRQRYAGVEPGTDTLLAAADPQPSGDTAHGVAIHRGTADVAAAAEPTAAAAAVAAEPVKLAAMSGVRIHRGVAMPGGDRDTTAAE